MKKRKPPSPKTYYVKSDFRTFPYGRPVGRFGSKAEAVREAGRRVKEGERAWVLGPDLKVVWGEPIRVSKNRVAMGEFWRMKDYFTRPQWVAGEERRRKQS